MAMTSSLTATDWIVNQSCRRAAAFFSATQGDGGASAGSRGSGGLTAVEA
jgi:hypothetical protein